MGCSGSKGTGGGKDDPGGRGRARVRGRRRPLDQVRVQAGTELDVALRLRGEDVLWVEVDEDGTATLILAARAS